jgi:hypothetical protein
MALTLTASLPSSPWSESTLAPASHPHAHATPLHSDTRVLMDKEVQIFDRCLHDVSRRLITTDNHGRAAFLACFRSSHPAGTAEFCSPCSPVDWLWACCLSRNDLLQPLKAQTVHSSPSRLGDCSAAIIACFIICAPVVPLKSQASLHSCAHQSRSAVIEEAVCQGQSRPPS